MSRAQRDKRALGARGLIALGRRSLVVVAILGASSFLLVSLLSQHHPFLFDFKGGLYAAGRAILSGHNPYHASFIAHQAAIMRAGGVALGETSSNAFSVPVYPAPANLAVVPLSLLPYWCSAALFTLSCVAAMALALRLLEVRDWRCYGLAFISWPFLFGLEIGAVAPLIMLGVAGVWRWRQRCWPPAIALAAIVVAKVFPWPLAAWLLVTRRYRTLGLAAVLGITATLLAWAVLGFAGMTSYPKMLSDLSFIQERRAVSLVAVFLSCGLPVRIAQALALAAAAALLGVAWRVARSPDGERAAFGLAIIAVLTASPIVWDHYLVLLFVPVALLSPRLSALWLIPLAGPLVLGLSLAILPAGPAVGGSSPATVREAIMTLALEGILVYRLSRGVVTLPVSEPEARAAWLFNGTERGPA